MKRLLSAACITLLGTTAVLGIAASVPAVAIAVGIKPITTSYAQINNALTGNWQQYGQLFTNFQSTLFSRLFLTLLILVPSLFFLHYLVIGAKQFNHDGPQVLFFPALARLVHWLAALSFSLLVVTGLMVIFGKYAGGGSIVMGARIVHLISALAFTGTAVFMFFIWIKDMLPMPCDIAWLFIAGGYLSKKKKPVPAGKFNAGQKMWFWLATVGGAVMAYSGWYLYTFQMSVDELRIMAIIHNFLGAALVTLFLVHLYMSLLAIKGSLTSMITGYKPLDEVRILHSRYTIPS